MRGNCFAICAVEKAAFNAMVTIRPVRPVEVTLDRMDGDAARLQQLGFDESNAVLTVRA